MKALRLAPPEIPWTPELRWVLARAFGPPSLAFPDPVDPVAGRTLATTLDLAPRIGARTPETVLAAEAGPQAPAFRQAALRTAAQGLVLLESVRAVATVAAPSGIPVVLLKGLALEAQGLVPPGARPTSDLDLLVPEERIDELTRLLLEAGWRQSPTLELEQHVDPLVHPTLGMAEIHRVALGVRLPGAHRSVGVSDLRGASLLAPANGLPDGVFAPAPPVLLAHSLVHGLVQHGPAPASYPAFRVLGDVADLGASAESLDAAGAFLRELDREDLAAVGALVRALLEGRDPASIVDPPAAAILLRHLVAGLTVPDYAAGLRSSTRFLVPLSDSPPALSALRSAWRAAVLSRDEVDRIYGRPRTSFGYVARQVARPFDLALRWVRYAGARRRA